MAATSIEPRQMAAYRATALARQQQRQEDLKRRRRRAWDVARGAADLLRRRFRATRVVVFGSLSAGPVFDERSDIDLAAWGIPFEDFWPAAGAVAALDTYFVVDLIRVEEASRGLVGSIEAEATDV